VKTIIKKPHLLFFSLVPLFLIIGFIKTNEIIDVTVYNTFFAVKVHYWCYFSAVFLGLIGLNYYLIHWLKKPLVQILSLFHVIFQIAAIVPFVFCIFFINEKRSYNYDSFLNGVDLYNVLSTSFLLFLVSFFLHLLNFFISLISKK
jgi:hypothetical protein